MRTISLFDEPARVAGGGDDVLSVVQLNKLIRHQIEQGFGGPVRVRGVLSNPRLVGKNKHLIFDLFQKNDDDEGIVKQDVPYVTCWFFSFSLERWLRRTLAQHSGFSLRELDRVEVLVEGRVSVREVNNNVSIVVSNLEIVDGKALATQAERVAALLEKEGVFRRAAEKKWPSRLSRLGVVCGRDSAAWADIKTTLSAEPGLPMQIFLFPCQVQGADAPQEIIKALNRAKAPELGLEGLLLARGGGSESDLSTFNHEGLVRALADCPLPVIVAVGHASDAVIAEKVSALPSITPTKAAERIRAPYDEMVRAHSVSDLILRAKNAALGRLDQIEAQGRQLVAWVPDLLARRLAVTQERLRDCERLLDLLDPKTLLRQGYVVALQEGCQIGTLAEYDSAKPVTFIFDDGELTFPPQS